MSNKDSMIPSDYAIRLLEQAQASGCDRDDILNQAELDWVSLQSRREISGKRYGLLYQAVMRAAEDEWFGMFVGGKVPLGSFRMMCLTLLTCANLQQAIIRAGEFSEICRGMKVRFKLDVDEQIASVSMAPVHSISVEEYDALINDADPSYMLTSIIAWHKFTEWLAGKTIPLVTLQLSYPAGKNVEPLAYAQNVNIQYDAPKNGFSFPVKCLDFPLVQDHDSLLSFLRTAPYHLVTEDSLKLSFGERVRNILKRDVSRAMPSAEQLASQLNMSVTTLRRQLSKDSVSYQKLKDDCRMEAAIYYLSCLELSNSDIAEKLGFDEPSAFFRSFKKWTGQTPGEYRARLNQKA
ncbi:AraC family transcriptional regulator [Teredinibacter purpureus]|jgi:transcriptional regulator, AraC family|uniref:AraC family transcriptional regulator n=1 Tax=Teredinibacter purpureus TaxID=2731756 RepID=UPI0005F7CE91|nr:AraC family transcriptional regulator [Teredinibacter purpureus]